MKSYVYNLSQRFKKIAEQYAEKTAIQFTDGTSINFKQLDELSNQIGEILKDKKVVTGDLCCIAGVKKELTYATFIACIKNGVTYSFFDPESPDERLKKIFSQCNPKLVIGYMNDIDANLYSFNYSKFDLNNFQPTAFSENNISEEFDGSTPAYVMFTSGSTGFPKGAVMTHCNVLNFIDWCRDTFDITSNDVHTNINPLYFDNSVFDLYGSLFNGATVVPINKNEALQPKLLLNILESYNCTTWFSVPSMLMYLQTSRAIIPEKWKNVKKIIFGGEGYPKGKLVQLFNALKANTIIYNVYGPTECTCICSSYKVDDNDFYDVNGFLPLGKMAENFSYLIVDDNGIETDGKGELILRGPNVGLGYYNDIERTKERFIQNPTQNNYIDICYKTGDLVSYNTSDNKIYIHGRTDNQIKHMGYRIELEEIENALCCIKGINEAAVFIINELNGNKIFAVYESSDNLNANTIKIELKKLVPNYMLPSEIFSIERIPKNANGKTDRLQLKNNYTKQ